MAQEIKTPRRLFPMHLTPFECYMYFDDTPEYPMTYSAEMEFSGKIDRQAFEEAVAEALPRHPLLTAHIALGKRGRDCWIDSGGKRPTIDWGDLDEEFTLPQGEFIDITKEIGIRIWVRHNDERAILLIQFHHACVDGGGGYLFIGDMLWSYACRTSENPSGEQLPMESHLLKTRGRLSYKNQMIESWKGLFKAEYGELARILLKRVTPLRVPKERNSEQRKPMPFPGYCTHDFDKNEFRTIRLKAQERGQNGNDFLLEALFRFLEKWNREQSGSSRKCDVNILMPVDLRDGSDHNTPGHNCVSYWIVRRDGATIADPEKLNRSLRDEMIKVKNERYDTKFMNLVVRGQALPAAFKMFLKLKNCMATAVFSNAGDPTKRFRVVLPRKGGAITSGNLKLEHVRGVPPIRAKTRLAVSVCTYRKVLNLCVRCDPNHFSKEENQMIMDGYLEHIRQELGE